MITHEFQKDIDAFIAERIEKIKDAVNKDGGVNPYFSILYLRHKKVHSMEIPVPHYMMSEDGKEHLTKIIMPTLLKLFSFGGGKVICVGWTVEAWMWMADARTLPLNVTQKHLSEIKKTTKKTEIIMLSFETEYDCTPVWFKKLGSRQGANGEAQGIITLERMPVEKGTHIEGRFATLFRQQRSNK